MRASPSSCESVSKQKRRLSALIPLLWRSRLDSNLILSSSNFNYLHDPFYKIKNWYLIPLNLHFVAKQTNPKFYHFSLSSSYFSAIIVIICFLCWCQLNSIVKRAPPKISLWHREESQNRFHDQGHCHHLHHCHCVGTWFYNTTHKCSLL